MRIITIFTTCRAYYERDATSSSNKKIADLDVLPYDIADLDILPYEA